MKTFEDAFRLDHKTALITGGATGIGFGIAECMVKAGAKVILAARRKDKLEEACAKLGPNATGIEFDITDTEKIPAFVKEVIEKAGNIDILVNNAGNTCKKPIEDVTKEDLQSVLDVHVLGSYLLSQAIVPYMKERQKGSIIFISSMTAYLSMDHISVYSVSKSAVGGIVRSFASEVSPCGVRVNAIAPGWIMTPMFEKVLEVLPSRREKVLGRTPLKEFGTPEDIGWAAVYLASEASSFVTGTTMIVDGGAVTGL